MGQECYLCGTERVLIWHKSGIPIDLFFVAIEVHFWVSSNLFEYQSYHLLLLWRKKDGATPALVVLVASEVENEGCHKLVVLLRIHVLFEVCEASGKYYGLFISIIFTRFVFAAFCRINQTQILFILNQSGVGNLAQACGCHRAVVMFANGIVVRCSLIVVFSHNVICFKILVLLCFIHMQK